MKTDTTEFQVGERVGCHPGIYERPGYINGPGEYPGAYDVSIVGLGRMSAACISSTWRLLLVARNSFSEHLAVSALLLAEQAPVAPPPGKHRPDVKSCSAHRAVKAFADRHFPDHGARCSG